MAWKFNPFTGTLDYYEAGSGSGASIGGAIGGGPTAGSVLFVGAGGVLQQDNANFFWDDTNNFLGIGTNAPRSGLEVRSGPPLFIRGISGLGLIDDYWGIPWITGAFQVDAATYYGMTYLGLGDDYYAVWQEFVKSRSTDGSTYAIVHNGDELGRFNFYGDLGAAAAISSRGDNADSIRRSTRKHHAFRANEDRSAHTIEERRFLRVPDHQAGQIGHRLASVLRYR